MELEKSLSALSNSESFANFIFTVRELREESIEELHNAPSEKIQQISGMIITYDQILKLSNYDQLLRRFG